MTHDAIRAKVLCTQIVPNADEQLLKSLKLPRGTRSLGLITADSDDVAYAALDEATKKAQVRVAFAKSMYAGAGNASTALAGEFFGILAGPTPSEVRSGLDAVVHYIKHEASFFSANSDDSVVYFAHCISRTGSYLSALAKVPEGTPMAYLIAPPAEALFALDAALKTAEVDLRVFYGPPTETNFAGGLFVGEQAACVAACEAFAESVRRVAESPLQ